MRYRAGMDLIVRKAQPLDLDGAERVWHAANVARGITPTEERVARVREKLRDRDSSVVVGLEDERVVAMALAEPDRDAPDRGSVAQLGARGHVSMVFVDPERWGNGVGRRLLAGLDEVALERGWAHLRVWTRESNARAKRLYTAAGYRLTGARSELDDDERIEQYGRDLGR